ncbi:MAG: hypothetical protein GY913_32955 [Proteobacteria bacterium]|nr:hypothetical protein [Pseudomonadota bacterium]MCP4921734.1 hypothetical protein [Pseudomonadota bacterium]
MSYDVTLHAAGLVEGLSRLGYRIGHDSAVRVDEPTQVRVRVDLDDGQAILRVPTPRLDAFGRVAADDLDVLAQQVSLQVDGAAWDRAGFLAGWASANARAHEHHIARLGWGHAAQPSRRVTRARAEALYAWNRERDGLQHRTAEDFVPNVFLAEFGDGVETYVVWGDGMPMWMPRVDRVVVARDQLRAGGPGPYEERVVRFAELEHLLGDWEDGALPWSRLTPTPEVVAWVRGLDLDGSRPQGVHLDDLYEVD